MKKTLPKKSITLAATLMCIQLNSGAHAANCVADYATDFPVFRNAWTPPTDTDPDYKYFPGSQFFTTNTNSILNSSATAGKYIFQWVNRCQDTPTVSCGTAAGKKGNLPQIEVDGVKHRFFFTNKNKADACTRAQLYNSLEAYTSATNVLINNSLIEWNVRTNPGFVGNLQPVIQLPDEPDTGFIDTCYLYDATGLRAKADGVVFDYEPQDDRSPSRTTSLSQYFHNFLKRSDIQKEMVLWTNALANADGTTSAAAQRNGIIKADNGRDIYDLYDRVSILVDDQDLAADIDQVIHNQQRVYRPRSYAELNQKMYVIVGLGEMSNAQLQQVRLKIQAQNYNGIAIWHDGATASIDTNGNGTKDLTIDNCDHPVYSQLECLVDNTCN